MSWFTELAGKAENFLNKVDQSAAVALQRETRSRGPTPVDFQDERRFVDGVMSASFTGNGNIGYNHHSEQPSIKQTISVPDFSTFSAASTDSKLKKPSLNSDEKLLEFLNSETVVEPKRNKTQRTTDDIIPSVKESKDKGRESVSLAPEATEGTGNRLQSEAMSSVTRHVEEEPKSETEHIPESDTLLNIKQQHLSSLELENKLIRKEVASLNHEVSQASQKMKAAEAESSKLRQQLEVKTNQTHSNDRILHELQSREADLKQALDAKDSQLAVLRVRLREADELARQQKALVDRLQSENERLLQDYSNSSNVQNQTLQSATERLSEVETALEQDRIAFRNLQDENIRRIGQLEHETATMAASVREAEEKLAEERAKAISLTSQVRLAQSEAENSQKELADYKQKAQRILQSKEKIISTLKEGGSALSASAVEAEQQAILESELEELKQERQVLREELQKSHQTVAQLRSEIQDLESHFQAEANLAREQTRGLDGSLKEERRLRIDYEQEAFQLKEELRYLREDYERQKTSYSSRIQDREIEIEKLRKQLTARQINSNGQIELEMRLATLTESLIQKQTMVETLNTEKNSLVLQLERLELQLRESQNYSRQTATSTAVNLEDSESKLRVPGFLRENPFDGQVTRKVKRVYNTIDAVSVRLGVFLRRYPIARIFVIAYMILLHLWVLIVLSTYNPEVHPLDFHPGN